MNDIQTYFISYYKPSCGTNGYGNTIFQSKQTGVELVEEISNHIHETHSDAIILNICNLDSSREGGNYHGKIY